MERNSFFWLFLAALLVYCLGFSIDIMDVDSAQYAAISREMAETGNYLQVQLYGKDYLDKPPLLFWITSLFFNVLGCSNWSFKLGSFLFTLVGVYSTFRLGKLLYDARIGRLAAIILLSCQAFFLFNNDVRTDTILTASVIFAIWQIMEWLHHRKWKWLIGAAIGIACAMMAKGPVGLMVPVLAVGSYLLGKGRWRDFFHWQYFILIIFVAILLAPMLWGLYQQFDAQPEKSVGMITPHGLEYKTDVSGLKFYLWTQSFGRITGENVWVNNAGSYFFIHNFLWSFLPWSLLFVLAFFHRLVKLAKTCLQRKEIPELLTLGGFILPFLILSMSNYKLPHYIFVLYPLSSILLASWWERDVWQEFRNGLKLTSFIFQMLVWTGSVVIICFIFFWFFPGSGFWKPFVSLGIMILALLTLLGYKKQRTKLIIASVLISVAANFAMNSRFYPQLLQYQSGSNMAKAIHQHHLNADDVYSYNFSSFSYYYYREKIPENLSDRKITNLLESGKPLYITTTEGQLGRLAKKFTFEVLHQFGSHSVTLLNLKFLDPKTREQTLQQNYLLEITGRNPREDLKISSDYSQF